MAYNVSPLPNHFYLDGLGYVVNIQFLNSLLDLTGANSLLESMRRAVRRY